MYFFSTALERASPFFKFALAGLNEPVFIPFYELKLMQVSFK